MIDDEEIRKVYELLGLANEEQRREILARFYPSPDKDDITVAIGADSVTTPYSDNNA